MRPMQVRSVQRAIHFVRVGSSSVRDSKNIKSLVLLSPPCLSLPLCKTYRTQQRICRCLVAHKTTCEAGVLSFCRTSEVTSPVLLLLHPPPLPPPARSLSCCARRYTARLCRQCRWVFKLCTQGDEATRLWAHFCYANFHTQVHNSP